MNLRSKFTRLLILLIVFTAIATAQIRKPGPAAQKPAPSAARVPGAPVAQKPRYKAIFEPVNYGDDVMLMSAYCADEKTCWAAGGATEMKGGVIIETKDAGAHWTVVAGDPQSGDRAFRELHFSGSTGFAVQRTGQASNLYRSDDGEHWLPVGKIAEHHRDYYFSSPTNGVSAGGNSIEYTQDGGKTWNAVLPCAAKVSVNGLARNVRCEFMAMSFPTATTGYVTAKSGETDDNLFLAKTTDGGASWNLMTLDVHHDHPGPEDVHFTDENTGYMRVGAGDTGKLYKTTDGGEHWTAIAPSPGDEVRFADNHHSGWAFRYSKMGFSADGDRWSSRDERFPASPRASTLPHANFGLVVGDHGMAYRYRIVPIDYTSKGMIDAPALSSTPTE